MIGLPAGTRIWIAAGVTDLRRGFTGLSGMVQTTLQENPFSGHVFVFRGRRGDLIKMLWWDGDGLCLFARKIHLAAIHERSSGADSRTIIHVAGRNRLAASGTQLRSADGGVKENIFSIFWCVFIML
jgi:transposase